MSGLIRLGLGGKFMGEVNHCSGHWTHLGPCRPKEYRNLPLTVLWNFDSYEYSLWDLGKCGSRETCSLFSFLKKNLCREMLLKPQSCIQVIEGAKHNLPDRESLRAADAIRELAEGLTAEDLLLVLISGMSWI